MAGPLVVLGASGQVGRGLLARLGPGAVGLTRTDLDLSDLDRIEPVIAALSPAAVINAAAYTDVDGAEQDERSANIVNGDAPGRLATVCARRGIALVHFSTDYVFSGRGRRPWRETDPSEPRNAYGRSKLRGERLVAAAGGRWLIFRTSWIYDSAGRNFVTTMLRLGRTHTSLDVVADQFGAPTYAPWLAGAAVHGLDRALAATDFRSGTYHLCAGGTCSWYGFAKAIFGHARRLGLPLKVASVKPVGSDSFPRPAKRPRNSRLDTALFASRFGVEPPDWRDGLRGCFQAITARPV